MTITDIIRNGRGTAHAWHVEPHPNGGDTRRIVHLRHYGTTMLVWSVEDPHDLAVLDYSTGWGSVSDQNGMNTAFRELGLPYRFDRDARGGGPRVTELVRGPEGHYVHPNALRPRRPRPCAGGAAVATVEAPPDLSNLHPAELAALPFEWQCQLAAIRDLPERS
jgi:hypothetical protein